MFESINDLPSHVFFVHVPIVAIPVMSLLAVIMGILKRPPAWLRHIVLGGTILTVIATWFAIKSGEAFDEIVGDRVNTDRHESLGETTLWFALGLTIAVIGLSYVTAKVAASLAASEDVAGSMKQARIVLSAATILFAGLSTVWVVRTGEEGAKLVWNGVIPADDDEGE